MAIKPFPATSGPHLAEDDAKAQDALEARADGLTWREVAKRVGYSDGDTAQRAVERYANRRERDAGRAAEHAEWIQRVRRKTEKFQQWAEKSDAPVASLAETIARTLEIEGQGIGALTAQRSGAVNIQNQVATGANPVAQPGDDLAGADEREIRDLLRAVSASDAPLRDIPGT